MGFKTELQSNNVDLQSILNKINALPEAGSGGGGSSGDAGTIETCTVVVNVENPNEISAFALYESYEEVDYGSHVDVYHDISAVDCDFSTQFYNVVKNSPIIFYTPNEDCVVYSVDESYNNFDLLTGNFIIPLRRVLGGSGMYGCVYYIKDNCTINIGIG